VKIVIPLINILLADDDIRFCQAVKDWIQKDPGFRVVGEAHDGRQAVSLATTLKPDVILMDLAMPEFNGIDATREITHSHDTVRVIAMSLHSENRLKTEMFRAGAADYVIKENIARDLLPAIRAVVRNAPGKNR
jgi:DNA-binding NarL/FixJ family response regulator